MPCPRREPQTAGRARRGPLALTQRAQAGLFLRANPSVGFLTSYVTVLSLLISIAKHRLGDELFENASAVIYTNTLFSKGNRGKC